LQRPFKNPLKAFQIERLFKDLQKHHPKASKEPFRRSLRDLLKGFWKPLKVFLKAFATPF
jgi:hypothetical protein